MANIVLTVALFLVRVLCSRWDGTSRAGDCSVMLLVSKMSLMNSIMGDLMRCFHSRLLS